MNSLGLCFHNVVPIGAQHLQNVFQHLVGRFVGSIGKHGAVLLQTHTIHAPLDFLVLLSCALCTLVHALCCYGARISSRSIAAGIDAILWCWIGIPSTIRASTAAAAMRHTVVYTTACVRVTVGSCLSSSVVPCQMVILSIGKGPPIMSFSRIRRCLRIRWLRRRLRLHRF